MTAVKVGAIVALSLALVATGSGLSQTGGQWWPEAGGMNVSLLTSVGIAMVSVLWAYEGWQYVTFSAGEATNPQRTFPRAALPVRSVMTTPILK